MTKRPGAWKSPLLVFLIVFCVAFVGGTSARHAFAKNAVVGDSSRVVANWREIARTGHIAGSVTPAVTVVVFADYQCVGCAAFHPMLQTALRLMPQDLRVVTRHFPLSGHRLAAPAASAAECAADQGRFAQMEDVLYAAQDSIGQSSWTSFALQAGVRDTVVFNTCIKKERFASVVDRDRLLAHSLQLKGTPTYLVNGALHFGAPSEAVFLQQLRDAASEVRAARMDSARTIANGSSTRVMGANGHGQPVRKWLAPLTLERTILGEKDDELLIPGALASTPTGDLVVFDYGAMEVRAFNRAGKQLWRLGRKGAGPGEFRNVMDLKARSNDELAVLDMANRRITALTAAGKVKRTISIKLSSSRFVALDDTNTYALAGDDSSTLWNSVSLDGKLSRHMAAPTSLVAHHSLSREQFTAPLGNASVMAYRWSDKIVVLQADGAVQSIIDGVEPIALPSVKQYPVKFGKFSGLVARVDPNAVQGALSVATNGHQIFVLFAGATEQRGRIIDVYDADDGQYAGSILLPLVAQEIVSLPDGAIAALRMEPVPALDVFVGVAKTRPSAVTAAATLRSKGSK